MMSYNTRRSSGFPAQTTQSQPQQTVTSIGQRRPVSANFVSGGQLNPQNKTGTQMAATQPATTRPQQQSQQQTQNAGYRTAQGYTTQQQQGQTPANQDVKPVIQGANPPNPALDDTENGDDPMDSSSDDTQKKKVWNRSGTKISKREKIRRRNIRLSNMLQPKNAVMILNELVNNTSYMVEELSNKTESNQFKATVLVDGVEHIGYGRSKIHAKNDAAENALKQFIKTKKLGEMKKDEEGNEKMDVSEDGTQPPLPWQHVASFALFKLFCSWGEDPNVVKAATKAQAQVMNSDGTPKQHENKPAKKMPENPETMNPLMLLNQMLPHAQFEEVGKTGNPPNISYSYRCSVDGQSFIGTGPNKKAAKKQAAYGVCNKVLDIKYPADVFSPVF